MVDVLWYAGTICAYLIPFFIVWVITRRFEREAKRIISSTYFLIAFAFILAYIFAITYFEFTTWEIHYLFHLLVNLPLIAGTFFMYFFLLKLREEIGAEKATSRLFQSVLPIIFLSIFFIGIFGAIGMGSARLTGSFSGSMNPFFGLHLLSYPIGVIFASLSYLEMAYLLKTFKVKLRHLVYFAAFLLLGTPTLWMFDLVSYWLMLSGTPYVAVETAPALLAGIITLFASLPLWIELKQEVPSVEKLKPKTTYERGIVKLVGQIGDIIGRAAVKMLLFYVRAYNKLYEKEVKVDESLKFEGLKGGEEKDLAKFITLSFKNDLGPSVLRYAKSLDEFKDIVEEIEVKVSFLK
jgi:hypothetical protein